MSVSSRPNGRCSDGWRTHCMCCSWQGRGVVAAAGGTHVEGVCRPSGAAMFDGLELNAISVRPLGRSGCFARWLSYRVWV